MTRGREHYHQFKEEYETVLVMPADGSEQYEILGRFCEGCPAMLIQEGGFSKILILKATVEN